MKNTYRIIDVICYPRIREKVIITIDRDPDITEMLNGFVVIEGRKISFVPQHAKRSIGIEYQGESKLLIGQTIYFD